MLLNALLLSLIYLVSRTDMINGYMMLTKPIVLGPLVGLVLGDLQAGILIGATLELAFIGVMNIGISVSMDVSIATIVGGGLAILSGQDAAFALTIAIDVYKRQVRYRQLSLLFRAGSVSGPDADSDRDGPAARSHRRSLPMRTDDGQRRAHSDRRRDRP